MRGRKDDSQLRMVELRARQTHWGLQSLHFPHNSTNSMSILLRHQTRSAFVQNHVRLLRRFTHSSIATKDSHMITKHVPFLKRSLVSRSFHSSPVDYSNCDFSSPCVCSECMQDQRKPICEICRVHPTVHQSYGDSHDRKGIRSYSFTSYCEQFWQKRDTARWQMACRFSQKTSPRKEDGWWILACLEIALLPDDRAPRMWCPRIA